MQTIDRAMQILHLLMKEKKPRNLSISEISKLTALPLSTTHRIISSLVEHGLLIQTSETKQYSIGPRWVEYGLKVLEDSSLRTVALPVMKDMSKNLKESIYLSVPNGLYAILIERVDSPSAVRVVDHLGARNSMHLGAPNKIMLANYNSSDALNIIKQLISEKEISSFMDSLPQLREQGYAISKGDIHEGTIAVASPIIGLDQQVLGALCINLLEYQTTNERIVELTKEVIKGAQQISSLVGAKSY